MRILDLHVSRAVLGATAAAVGLFAFVLFTGNALKDLVQLVAGGRVPLDTLGRLLALLVPHVVGYALPLGLLAGILMALGRLSASGEITAMRAAGVSIPRIALPIFGIALAGVALGLWVHPTLSPQARQTYRQVIADLVRKDPLSVLQPKVFIQDFPGQVIRVHEIVGPELRRLWIWELDDQGRATTLVRAASGTFSYDAGAGDLVLGLVDASAELRDRGEPDNLVEPRPMPSFREARIRLPVDHLLEGRRRTTKISHLTRAQLGEREAEILARLEGSVMDAEARGSLLDELGRVRKARETAVAMAFSPLALATLAIPLALTVGRKETYANAALALFLGLAYYFCLSAVDWIPRGTGVPAEWLVWLPNVVFQAVGIGLFLVRGR